MPDYNDTIYLWQYETHVNTSQFLIIKSRSNILDKFRFINPFIRQVLLALWNSSFDNLKEEIKKNTATIKYVLKWVTMLTLAIINNRIIWD